MNVLRLLPALTSGLLLAAPAGAAEDVTFTTITSLHYFADANGEGTEDQPKGWPPTQTPLAPPLFSLTENSQYLLLPVERARADSYGALLRSPAVASHYQVEGPKTEMGIEPETMTVQRADGSTFQASSDYRLLGNYVQRNNGDVIGIVVPPMGRFQYASPPNPNSAAFSTELFTDGALQGGALYRLDSDGNYATLLEASIGVLHAPVGYLLHDPDSDVVYGIDEGPQGNGRLFRLWPDNRVDILYTFANQTGRDQLPNGVILGEDGMLYGLLGYDRGMPYRPGTLTDPQTEVGAVYRLDPADPDGGIDILHTFTLTEGEINVANPGRRRWLQGSTGYHSDQQGDEQLSTVPVLSHLVAGPDGWLYGGTAVGECQVWVENSFWGDDRAQSAPLCGWNISLTNSLRYYVFRRQSGTTPYIYNSNGYPDYPNGVTEWPYGIQHPFYDGPRPYGALYRVNKDTGEFQLLHEFDYDDGASPRGPMALGPDGNIYGTTLTGGTLREFEKTNGQVHKSRNGILYRIDPTAIQVDDDGKVTADGFELLRDFTYNQEGNTPIGVVRGTDDRLYGASLYGGQEFVRGASNTTAPYDDYGTLFVVDTSGTAIEGSVVLTATPPVIQLGETSELTWTGNGVENCQASSGLDAWNGTLAPSGSIDVSPAAGNYYLSIACEDQNTGRSVSDTSVLRVDMESETEDGNSVSYGNGGGSLGVGGLVMLLGVALLRRRIRRTG
ncbi:hypothetical protein A6D6_03694 [Alcanivorax xiamenensis]|uniref:Ig-like domain-containing protein n=1 Tax=Alcanivorax xiamenensis TaxID=1177156 RepID=A0ABQ6Y3U7_9GAMM|nr:choice-of-anchor tandem repeat GloVer-containing protein [Alcanivorax xiamenensis]KAF0803478.1 hypothetical protein A6D6_03694 [Alcanivorax xiamenensis]